jgi:hypothetical protein
MAFSALRSAAASFLAVALASTAGAQNQALSVSSPLMGGYIEIPAGAQLAPPSFTLEAWFTYDGSTLPAGWNYPTIGRKEFTQGTAEWFLRVDAGNIGTRTLRLWVNGSGGVVHLNYPFAAGAYLNWTHIAVTYDGGFAIMYINGVQVAQANGTGPLVSLGAVARIGAGDTAPGSANERWNGLLDEVRFWSVARTPTEIQSTMFQAITSAPNLTANYHLEGNGLDSSGNGNHGAPIASPVFVNVPLPGGAFAYCTAKVNALGCTPTISWTGTPSATAGSGFVVKGSNVRNNKSGLLFYGINGGNSLPFQGGTLCVASQVKRTGALNSFGTPAPSNDCSGIYAIDMNLFAVSAGPPVPLAALQVPGTVVNCQFWGRDPGFPAPFNTTLTDGLEYPVGL